MLIPFRVVETDKDCWAWTWVGDQHIDLLRVLLMNNVSGTRASTMYAGVMREGALGKDT